MYPKLYFVKNLVNSKSKHSRQGFYFCLQKSCLSSPYLKQFWYKTFQLSLWIVLNYLTKKVRLRWQYDFSLLEYYYQKYVIKAFRHMSEVKFLSKDFRMRCWRRYTYYSQVRILLNFEQVLVYLNHMIHLLSLCDVYLQVSKKLKIFC